MRATASSSPRSASYAGPALPPAQRPSAPAAPARARRRQARRPAGALLLACRPRQWVKNLLVTIAPAAAGVLTRPQVQIAELGAFASFCLLASATYLVNDVRDREQDRMHPRKRHRPIAAGTLRVDAALRSAAMLALAGLTLALLVAPKLALVALAYLALTSTYSLWWRRVIVVDLVAIAAGFLLRTLAGGVAAGVPLSRSLLIVTSACALFLIAGKRHAELAAGARRRVARSTLRRYSPALLRWLLGASAGLACVAYARWAFARPELGAWFELSIIPFGCWLGRYALMLRSEAAESPERLIFSDPVLLALGALWAVLFLGGVYGAH